MTGPLQLTLDCRDPQALAPFWAEALGYTTVGNFEQYTMLLPPAELGPGAPRFLLQGVPEPKGDKNRFHLDLHVDDIDAEVARLEAVGGRRLGERISLGQTEWVVMADPEGNEFCVCREGVNS
ncbi:MAG TPA: VOC family protein [Acidimicrobiales bacterium]|nr:VOC family protein [Acidimicrobiales bacterium]